MTVAHKDITTVNRHPPFNFVYADATAREAATGFVPADVTKLALQLDDASLWTLTDDDPITWSPVGTGDMNKSVYDTDDDGIVNEADVAGTAALADVATIANDLDIEAMDEEATPTTGDFFVMSRSGVRKKVDADNLPGGDGGGATPPFAPWTIPVVADFTSFNLGSLTLVDSTRGIIIDNPAGGGFASRGFWKTSPTAPWNAYALLDLSLIYGENNFRLGLVLGNSGASDKLTMFGFIGNSGAGVTANVSQWNTPSSYSGDAQYGSYATNRVWIRVQNDATNLVFYLGDGYYWQQMNSRTIASFMGAVDLIGVAIQSGGRSLLTVHSFSTTAPATGGGGFA